MSRDLNGYEAKRSRFRLALPAAWTSRRVSSAELSTGSMGLVVVAEGFDDAVAASAILAASATFDPDKQSVLRHVISVPEGSVHSVAELAEQDRYFVIRDGDAKLLVERVQSIDALHISQERSRMAGLAQRHGGVALGWQVLQIP